MIPGQRPGSDANYTLLINISAEVLGLSMLASVMPAIFQDKAASVRK